MKSFLQRVLIIVVVFVVASLTSFVNRYIREMVWLNSILIIYYDLIANSVMVVSLSYILYKILKRFISDKYERISFICLNAVLIADTYLSMNFWGIGEKGMVTIACWVYVIVSILILGLFCSVILVKKQKEKKARSILGIYVLLIPLIGFGGIPMLILADKIYIRFFCN